MSAIAGVATEFVPVVTFLFPRNQIIKQGSDQDNEDML